MKMHAKDCQVARTDGVSNPSAQFSKTKKPVFTFDERPAFLFLKFGRGERTGNLS